MDLSPNDLNHYLRLEKGYQGEVMFDQLTDKLENDIYILRNLCLEVNNSEFQIDTLIIFQETIFPCEVKNFEWDYVFDPETESFKTISNNEILNPLDQVNRTKTLLRKLLQNHGYHFPIEGNVIFINPEFTLYKAPINRPIILPTQLSRFMKKLDQIPSKLNGRHKKLADLLISLHQNESRYAKIPPYTYEQQRKGVSCASCHSLSVTFNGDKCVCGQCGYVEGVDSAILRSVEELRLLFPGMKITTNGVHEWSDGIVSKKVIRRILKKNLIAKGERHTRYFE
jgi:ribosomal protein S27AE